uniref:Uncharacterized protein n=1 Tax=Setaria italica TaxID=4555 RepID=K3ZEC6_SETIT
MAAPWAYCLCPRYHWS